LLKWKELCNHGRPKTMLTGKRILVVSPNSLLCAGLKTLLVEYFSADNVEVRTEARNSDAGHAMDYVFIDPETYALRQDRFRGTRSNIVLLTDQQPPAHHHLPAVLRMTCPESEIIEQLRHIFTMHARHKVLQREASLTEREAEVLKLVARGQLNKQIADTLSISMHTVISHRKNITRKLGIKTVSGLTMYAVLNGLISSEDIR
jgi:DNA-binding CsgD family transcriptional regulator